MPLQIKKRRYILGYFVASRARARARAISDEILEYIVTSLFSAA